MAFKILWRVKNIYIEVLRNPGNRMAIGCINSILYLNKFDVIFWKMVVFRLNNNDRNICSVAVSKHIPGGERVSPTCRTGVTFSFEYSESDVTDIFCRKLKE